MKVRTRLARLLPNFGTWWWLAGLIVAVLVTAGLAIWALAATNARPVQQGALPIDYFNASEEPAVDPVDFVVPPRQLIALDADTAWRTLASSCPAEVAVVERTTDGGGSWAAVALTGTSTVLDLTAGTEARVSALVASSEDCALRYRNSIDGGETWGPALDRIPALDVLDALDPTILHFGESEVAAPCLDAVALSTVPGGHAVRCASGIVFALRDGEWAQVALPAPAVAVAHDGTGLIAFLRGLASCEDGIAVLAPGAVPIYGESALGPTPSPTDAPEDLPIIGYEDELRTCLVLDPAAPIAATTAADGTIWVWSGETVTRSTDGGAMWSGLE